MIEKVEIKITGFLFDFTFVIIFLKILEIYFCLNFYFVLWLDEFF